MTLDEMSQTQICSGEATFGVAQLDGVCKHECSHRELTISIKLSSQAKNGLLKFADLMVQ